MELSFRIRPGVSPIDRGDLEDIVVSALGGSAECTGGGGLVDGTECDFQVELDDRDPDEVIELCTAALSTVTFSMSTQVALTIDDEREVLLPTGSASA